MALDFFAEVENQYGLPHGFALHAIFPFCRHPIAELVIGLQQDVKNLLITYPSLWQEYQSGEWSFPAMIFEDLVLISKPRSTVWDVYDSCLDELEDLFSECSVYHPSSSENMNDWTWGEFEFDVSLWYHKKHGNA